MNKCFEEERVFFSHVSISQMCIPFSQACLDVEKDDDDDDALCHSQLRCSCPSAIISELKTWTRVGLNSLGESGGGGAGNVACRGGQQRDREED